MFNLKLCVYVRCVQEDGARGRRWDQLVARCGRAAGGNQLVARCGRAAGAGINWLPAAGGRRAGSAGICSEFSGFCSLFFGFCSLVSVLFSVFYSLLPVLFSQLLLDGV